MLRKRTALFVCLIVSVGACRAALGQESLPPAAQWVPQDAILVLQVSQPQALLDVASDPRVIAKVTSAPAYQQLASQGDFQQFLQVVKILEATMATDWRTGLTKSVGGGVTLAACPGDVVLLMVDAQDADTLKQLHEIFLSFARGEAQKQGQPDRVVSAEYRGVQGWTFNGKEAHAIIGNRLVLASNAEALKKLLDLRADPKAASLQGLPAYQAAVAAAGSDAAANVFLNLAVLKQVGPIKEALSDNSNPLASLLFAGVAESLKASNWLSAGLKVEDDTLALRAVVDGKAVDPSGAAAFACPSKSDQGALPNVQVPRRIAAASFWRDLHGFYAAKDDLFPDRTSGLIFFENMMGIFFSGRDLTEDVLAETEPEFRIVVAQQQYEDDGVTPKLQIPSFAAIFRLRDPEKFALVAEEAWQKAIGLVNFTRGQQAEPGLVIDRPTHDGVKYTTAYFLPSEDKEGGAARYNFQPCLAVVNEYLILSSSDTLTNDVIDALKKEIANPTGALGGTHSIVEFDAVQLASILRANQENMVRKNMVDKGSTKEQAEAEMGLLLSIVENIGQIKLDIGSEEGRTQATLQLKPNLQ